MNMQKQQSNLRKQQSNMRLKLHPKPQQVIYLSKRMVNTYVSHTMCGLGFTTNLLISTSA